MKYCQIRNACVKQETQFLKTMNEALEKNQLQWLQKAKETEEQSLQITEKDLKIRDHEKQVQELMIILERESEQQDEMAQACDLSISIQKNLKPK